MELLHRCKKIYSDTAYDFYDVPAAVEVNNSSKSGFFSDISKAYKEGKFKTYARWGGVLNVVVCIALCLLLLGY